MSGATGWIIVGAGGHGRGILEAAVAARSAQDAEEVIGFLDDGEDKQGTEIAGVPVLGKIEAAPEWIARGCHFLIGLGDPLPRARLVSRLETMGAKFASVVHPRATLYRDVTLGRGVVIGAGVVIAASTRLDDHSLVNLNATIGHDTVLEEFATVCPGANLGGFVTLETGAFVALGVTVIPGKRLGAWSKAGPNSAVLEDVAAGRIVFGSPARIVGKVTERP